MLRALIITGAVALAPPSRRSFLTKERPGAPLALDSADWDSRWSKGEQTLLEHTISGFNGMPAGGQCFSCSADDYQALTRFMAGREE